MKTKFCPILIAVLCIFAGCQKSSKVTDAATLKHLQSLLSQNEYFKLDAAFKSAVDKLSDADRLYFRAYLDNAFNRNEDCIRNVDSLIQLSARLPDTTKAALKRLQDDSYFKTFQYAKAARCDSDILKNYSHVLKKDVVDDIKNDLIIRAGLKNVPAQQTLIKTNTTISWKRDKIGLVNIPVTTHAQTVDAIFDTRANISSITQSYAKKLGLHMLDVTYNEGSGATGIQFKTGMGIADSLYIGDILVKNAVFQVMPDSILYIAPIKFQLNIIVGFPVIEQLQEVHIFKDGKMTIPLTPQKDNLHNFALNGLDPVIALQSGPDTLSFHFDSGASSSMLYESYFKKNKQEVLKAGFRKTVGFGGAGGTQKKEVWVLPKLNLRVGGRTVVIDSVSVLTKPIYPGEKFYGNIGQDFTGKFSELVYNFKFMYIKGVL
ncbi:retropepsin-like aspartic protease [Mucilaginibacter sp. L3T2-6]|uniref:aspartyl protease family protein n=1 Tax=Mucilaginibacter sp. L3T2-6 TaxID=3062491 RepID=UPI0026752A83|nr:retropepsin-like aspartic protease [Mucilaginibacter sp. L3T2-6]MDO3640392.1 retropepsin-like aspartic protease [Mucilaginibacter sp. L3T2-6]MDV6213269.1 retropepsin-like aspartic protease [Mucilaginibacter sp. L3T2-6]